MLDYRQQRTGGSQGDSVDRRRDERRRVERRNGERRTVQRRESADSRGGPGGVSDGAERRRQDRRQANRRHSERRALDRRRGERRRDLSRRARPAPPDAGFLTPEERDFLQSLQGSGSEE